MYVLLPAGVPLAAAGVLAAAHAGRVLLGTPWGPHGRGGVCARVAQGSHTQPQPGAGELTLQCQLPLGYPAHLIRGGTLASTMFRVAAGNWVHGRPYSV